MIEFVIDRSQSHVNLLKSLRKKPWSRMSEAERASWYSDATKGAYNFSDLNRVETAVAELAELLGLTLETKTDWTPWDTPVQADMERYLGNVAAIRDAYPGDAELPSLPVSMIGLNYIGANNIEKVLKIVYEHFVEPDIPDEPDEPDVPDIPDSQSSTIYCGEIYSGEVN